MHAKVVKRGRERTIGLVFEDGDEPISELERYAREQALEASRFAASGTVEHVKLACFDPDRRTYREIAIRERVAVVALVGDIASDGIGPKVQAHVVLERSDGSICGGHLLEARVCPQLDGVLMESQHTGGPDP